ncbi:MAG: NF038132 family protein [Alphaproteobacteria bacterium]|nr:NF038132 family protein [Alphaproteobacteria bacterium]
MGVRGIVAGAGIAALLLSASSAFADVCVGSCGTSGADGVVTLSPTGNATYQWISTAGGITGAGTIASVGNGGGSTADGSTLTTVDFAASAGKALTFFFNYVTSDGQGSSGNFTDYGWAELQTSSGSHVAWLFTARTEPSGNISPGQGLPADDSTLTPSSSAIIPGPPTWSPLGAYSGWCYGGTGNGCGYTGWIESAYTIASSGNYRIVFGVTNWLDNQYDTGLAFDGVSVGGVPISGGSVPEPATMGVALMGMGLLYGMLRARKAKSAA